MTDYARPLVEWVLVSPGQWVLKDDDGAVLRHILRLGPYLGGQPAKKWVVTGPGHERTEHPTRAGAMAAAEASLEA